MTFTETRLAGMFVIKSELYPDERGSFEAAWHRDALAARALETDVAQVSLAVNRRRGTIRGLHVQTLADDTEVLYFVSAPYAREHQRGIRWDDPALAIEWPIRPPTILSDRDTTLPCYSA